MDVSSTSPVSKQLNSCEIWMLSCTLMVVSALCEFGIILIIRFKKFTPSLTNDVISDSTKKMGNNDSNTGIKSGGSAISEKSKHSPLTNNFISNHTQDHQPDNVGKQSLDDTHFFRMRIDYISLLIFPITFFIFVISYVFLFYYSLHVSDD